MDIINDIVEFYLFSTKPRFKTIIYSQKSHRKIVLEEGEKKRIVFCPCKIVKLAQRYVLNQYLSEINYSNCAFAYTKQKSIVDMASFHLGNSFFLHLDIKHFFDNIDWDIFSSLIRENHPNSKLSFALSDKNAFRDLKTILTFRNKFRQGSVTTPYISNLYLFTFDNILTEYVSKWVPDGKYSRYSDDIIISSSKRIDCKIIEFVKNELKKLKLSLNYKKIKFFNINNHVNITGISLTRDGRTTINTKYKKHLKDMIYKALFSHKKHKINFNSLYGHIYFLIMCDPQYFNYLQVKYRNSKSGLLMLDELKRIEASVK